MAATGTDESVDVDGGEDGVDGDPQGEEDPEGAAEVQQHCQEEETTDQAAMFAAMMEDDDDEPPAINVAGPVCVGPVTFD